LIKTTRPGENPNADHLRHPGGIEDFLLFRMHKVVALAGSLVTRICEGQFGITRREWTVLAIVARDESTTWAEAARRLEIDDARLSRAVSSLATKGLLKKEHLPDRLIVLSLTEQGRQLYAELFPVARDINERMIGALSEPRVDALDESLRGLHAQAEELAREMQVPKARRSRGAKQK
jgi:DNA-binding MarR family transcriptional regulator